MKMRTMTTTTRILVTKVMNMGKTMIITMKKVMRMKMKTPWRMIMNRVKTVKRIFQTIQVKTGVLERHFAITKHAKYPRIKGILLIKIF